MDSECGEYEITTRRVQATMRNNVLVVWRLIRVNWVTYDSFGTDWDDVPLFALGVSA